MANGDYGYFGKGDTGYAQYMTAFNRNFGGSSGGGGGGHNNGGGLEMAAKKALQTSGKFIPWQVATISIDGKILD